MDEKLITSSLSQANEEKSTVVTARSQPTRVDPPSSQLQSIFEHVPEAVIFTDRDGRIQNMNTVAKFLLGETDEIFGLDEWPQKFGLYLDDATTYYPGDKMPMVRSLLG